MQRTHESCEILTLLLLSHDDLSYSVIFLLPLLHFFLSESLFNCQDMFKDVTTHELQLVA